jgi:hypothetical protein
MTSAPPRQGVGIRMLRYSALVRSLLYHRMVAKSRTTARRALRALELDEALIAARVKNHL